ncbi:hypothetical protein OG21DRAFT_1419802, partial [Imleria badia]
WHGEIIPAMLNPYFTYLTSHQLTHLPYGPCSCGNSHDLSLLVVYFDKVQDLKLSICKCQPASTQLIALGLFPSTPMRPSLAVSISLLEFNRQCFLQLPPNVSGWCAAVETFLKTRPFASSSIVSVLVLYAVI